MKGDEILEDQRVVRYVKPRLVHSTGHADPEAFVDPGAFVLRTFDDGTLEDGLSVNWLDVFSGSHQFQLQEVACRLRLKVTSKGRFAELAVGKLKMLLAAENIDASVIHDPLEADDVHVADPSHAQVLGLPPSVNDRATEVGAVLARAALLHSPPN